MIKSPVKSVVRDASPYLTGLLRSVSRLAFDFKDLVGIEKAGGNANVFYNPADLTSLYVGRDGTGGHPTVGDPVGRMLDTSGLSGSMEEFLSSQPELVTNGTFDTDTTGWTGVNATLASVSGQLQVTDAGGYASARQVLATNIGSMYSIKLDITASNISLDAYNGSDFTASAPDISIAYPLNSGSHELFFVAQDTSTTLSIRGNSGDGTVYIFDNISVKEVPGYHAIAPSDAARPTLMDDPDLTWGDLTDNTTRSNNLVDGKTPFASSGWTDNGDGSYSANATSFAGITFSNVGLEIGSEYVFSATISNYVSGTISIRTGTGSGISLAQLSADGIVTATYRVLSSADNFIVRANPDFVGTISGASVRKVNTAFDERGTTELVTNGDFSDGTTGWTLGTGWSVSNGVATHTGATPGYLDFSGAAVEGRHYEITYDIVAVSGGAYISPYLGSSPGIAVHSTVGTHTASGIATGTAFGFALRGVSGASASISVTNISVREVLYPNLLIQVSNFAHLQDDDSTFDTDTGNWNKGTGWTISGGTANHTGSAGSFQYGSIVEQNKWYFLRFYVNTITGGSLFIRIGEPNTNDLIVSTTGWHEVYTRADGTILNFFASTGVDVTIDNIVLQELPSTTPTSYYLDVDGVDDWMQVTPTLNLGEQWWHTGAWKSDDGNGLDRPFALASGYQSSPLTQGNKWVMWYADGSYSANYISDGSCIIPHILTVEQYDTNAMRGTVNGVGFDTFTPFDDSGAVQGLALFTQLNTGFGAGIDGRFYGGAWGQGQVNYDELDTLQKYLGTTARIEPTEVTPHTNVYDMLSAQTAAALFDIDDTTSLRVGRKGSDGIPEDGDPVGMMMDVSGTGGDSMSSYLATASELVTNGTFDTGDLTGWTTNITGTGVVEYSSGGLRIAAPDGLFTGALQYFLTIGKKYIVTFDVIAVGSGAGSNSFQLRFGSTSFTTPVIAGQSYSFIGECTVSTQFLLRNFGTTDITFDNISVKELPGYVAEAPSDAARPTLASVLDITASELTDDGTRIERVPTEASDFNLGAGTTYESGVFSVDDAIVLSTSLNPIVPAEDYPDVSTVLFNFSGGAVTPGVTEKTTVFSRSGVAHEMRFEFLTGNQQGRVRIEINTSGTLVVKPLQVSGLNPTCTFTISIKRIQTVFDGRGDELVTNGGFDTDSDWVLPVGASISNGTVILENVGTGQQIYQSYVLPVGVYEYTFDLVSITSGAIQPYIHGAVGGTGTVRGTVGTYTETLVITTAGSRIAFRPNNTTSAVVDNISVKEVLTPNLLLTSAGDDDSTFDTDTGNWTKGTGWTISGGVATHASGTGSGLDIGITVASYKWYKVAWYISSISGGSMSVEFRGGTTVAVATGLGSTGWHSAYVQAATGNNTLRFYAGTLTDVTIDNVIVQEVPASVARAFYLDFDGVDDNLILDGTDFGSSTNATLYKTFRGDTADLRQIMFGASNVTTAPFLIAAESGNGQTVYVPTRVGNIVYREDGAIAFYADRAAAFTALIDNTDHTIGVENVNMSLAVDWVNQGFYIGGEYDANFDSTGRLYSWAAVDTRLDGRDRDLLENYMLSKKT